MLLWVVTATRLRFFQLIIMIVKKDCSQSHFCLIKKIWCGGIRASSLILIPCSGDLGAEIIQPSEDSRQVCSRTLGPSRRLNWTLRKCFGVIKKSLICPCWLIILVGRHSSSVSLSVGKAQQWARSSRWGRACGLPTCSAQLTKNLWAALQAKRQPWRSSRHLVVWAADYCIRHQAHTHIDTRSKESTYSLEAFERDIIMPLHWITCGKRGGFTLVRSLETQVCVDDTPAESANHPKPPSPI